MRGRARNALIFGLTLSCAISPAQASHLGHLDPGSDLGHLDPGSDLGLMDPRSDLGHLDPGSDLRQVATRPLPQRDFASPFAEEYTFVGNNPATNMDPTGEIAWIPLLWGAAKLAAWGGLIGGASLGAADTYAQYETTAGFTAGDWNAGETAAIAGKGAVEGAIAGAGFAVGGGVGTRLAYAGLRGALGRMAGGTVASYVGTATGGIGAQAALDLAHGEVSSPGQYAFAAALGPVLRGSASALGGAYRQAAGLLADARARHQTWANQYVTLYRGTKYQSDVAAINAGYYLQSPAMRQGLAQRNAGFLSRLWHSVSSSIPPSQWVSLTTSRSVATTFAGPHGRVFQLEVRRGDLYRAWWNRAELEYLAAGGTRVRNAVELGPK